MASQFNEGLLKMEDARAGLEHLADMIKDDEERKGCSCHFFNNTIKKLVAKAVTSSNRI